jgi:predicted lipid-binding transport protein (Tim44 family)
VQSLATTVSAGVMPIGMALAGILFDLTGGNFWLIIGLPGMAMLAVSVAALLSRHYRSFLAESPQPAPATGSVPASAPTGSEAPALPADPPTSSPPGAPE